MLRWIIGSSLRLRRLLLVVALGAIVVGIVQVGRTSVDALPEFGPPTVEVQTEALGLSAAEVEQLITVPLEQDLLVGIPFLDTIESVSLPGLSSVVMTFESGTSVLDARQLVQERITQAVGIAGLPAVAKTPQMIQPLSATSRVAMVKLTSNQLTPIQMSVLARWVIAPRLMGVPGVANVAIWGNKDRQLQVLVDPSGLHRNGVTLQQVINTTGNALEVSPLSYLEASKPGTGGFLDMPNQRLNIFHEPSISSSEALAQVPVEGGDGQTLRRPGGPLTLGDVGQVVESHQPLIGDTACSGGEDCLLLVVEKFPGTSTIDVADGVESTLTSLREGLADMRIDSSVYRPASYVGSFLGSLGWALLAGSVLLLVVLFGLLWSWRRTLVVAGAVVTSAAVSVLVLSSMGTTVNLMIVAGLLLGVTALVADAVTDVDGIDRQLRENREHVRASTTVSKAIVDSASRLRRSIFYAVLIVAATTLPFFFVPGVGSAFLPPVALSYLLAVAASLVVALALTPGLALFLLSGRRQSRQSPLTSWLRRRYDQAARRMAARTGFAVGAFVAIALVALVAAPFLNVSMTPALNERGVVVQMQAPPGTSLRRMTSVASGAVADIGGLPGVRQANAEIGRAVTSSDRKVNVNEAQIWANIDPGADRDATVASIEDTMAGYPEVSSTVGTYTEERVRGVLPVGHDDVVVRVYGEDPTVLVRKAQQLRRGIAGIDGVSQVRVQRSPKESTVAVQVDLARAQAMGVKPGDVRRAAAALLGGITVGNLFQEQKVFDVVVWGSPQMRRTVSDVERLPIDIPGGGTARLGDVANVRITPTDATIRHDSVSRYVELTADVSGRSVNDVDGDVRALISTADFPLGHHAEVISVYAQRQADVLRLVGVGIAAVLAVLLLLQAAFRSWRLAAVVLAALPVSAAGGLVATLFTGGRVTIGVAAGLLAVFGVAVRELVLLIGNLQHLERREGLSFGPQLVVRGAADRIVPVLAMLAMAAFLLPVALLGGSAGFELLQPAAITVLGGLATTAVMTLFVVPAIYLRLGPIPDPDTWAEDLYEPVNTIDMANA